MISYKNFNNSLICKEIIELKGSFIYNPQKNVYVQKNSIKYTNEPIWLQYDICEIEFNKDNNSGTYREYYQSGKLKREVQFIKREDSNDFYANGKETIYYEYEDSYGNDTYTISEENEYKNMMRVGTWKEYSIDGVLMGESFYNDVVDLNDAFAWMKYTKYHNRTGKLAFINEKTWGKAFYENGILKAEWENKDYRNDGIYIEYYEDGTKKMEVQYKKGNRSGIMNKYFPDSKLQERWDYTDVGIRNFIIKYYNNGHKKSEWFYKEGALIKKIEYNKDGIAKK